jgi:carbon storage regulator
MRPRKRPASAGGGATRKEVPVLVLSRKQGEAIVIDGGIRITVVAVQGRAVRLGIEAPRSTSVDREEVAIRLARDGFQNWRPVERSGSDELDGVVEFPGWQACPTEVLLDTGRLSPRSDVTSERTRRGQQLRPPG